MDGVLRPKPGERIHGGLLRGHPGVSAAVGLPHFELKNRILKWNEVYHKMPWGVIFVMSGNIAISYALWECGAFKALMDWSKQLSSNTVWLELFFLFVTSIASEVTTSQLTDIHPLSLMLPVSAASEFNYMMPSSGARNAIIFEISYVSSLEMVRYIKCRHECDAKKAL
ncbi:hypothetical protein HPB48_000261 [Haemaphysalis longicornis]|uniref:Citrate transporter-like domain-containing protein n=1 Tax=Haemaphysalis longicornis TaxID=44386 RepID=A0A9J6GT85_HAELO|nr:hypothetical protein HPB48_000261 [Haemaphysalis longicornis]